MRGANFIFGYVDGEGAHVSDQYGSGNVSHSPDVGGGGSDDILEYQGKEDDSGTIIEFRIPLDSGDMRDRPLEPGETYTVLLAYHGSADNFTSSHTKRESITMTLD